MSAPDAPAPARPTSLPSADLYQLQHRYPESMDAWEGVGGSIEWWTEAEIRAGAHRPYVDDDGGACEHRLVPWTAGRPVPLDGRPR